MVTYTFPSYPAIDPTTETLVRGASGQVYDINDTAGTTPLAITDLNGLTITQVKTTDQGVTDSFRVEDHPEVIWRSGSYAIPLSSPKAMRDAAESAATDAAASRAAAEAAQAAAEAVQVQAATDHGALSGLSDDDHPQYLTATRGDSRYYTRAQVDSIAATAASQQSSSDRNRANHYGEQPISSVTGLQAALDAAGSGGGGGGAVASVNGRTGAVVVTKVDVGLGLVANTAPLDLPISSAVQNALNTKANASHVHAQSEITGLPAALTGKASVVIVTTGNEVRPAATTVLWIAAPGYAGGTPVNMSTGDLFFEGA